MQSLTLERPAHHATPPIRQILHVGCGAPAQGNDFMGHRTGFADRSLLMALMASGFADAVVLRSTGSFSLWAIAVRTAPDAARMRDARALLFPHKVPQSLDPV